MQSTIQGIEDAFEHGAGRTMRKLNKKTRPLIGKRPAVAAANPAATAYINANVEFAAREASRPNRVYTLNNPAGAATDVAAGASITCTFTFENPAYVADMLVTDATADAFQASTLKFASYDLVGGGGSMNLAGFKASMNYQHRPIPLQGRKFEAGQVASATFTNVSGAVAKFPGFSVWVIETTCVKDRKGTRIAPNVLSFARMNRILGNAALFQRRKIPR